MKPETVSTLLAQLNEVPRSPRLICIDGPAGSGKTTLAAELAEQLSDAQVIHLDDLYEGWLNPLGSNLTERLTFGILERIDSGRPLYYHRYDWLQEEFAEIVELTVGEVLIVEGVGAAQECMRTRADLVVFIDIDPQIGRARVEKRDGELVGRHMPDWQREEQAHFRAHNTRAAAQVFLRGDVD